MTYEVEIRFVVDEADEAFELLPFLKENLRAPSSWSTEIIGESIFAEGGLLRIGRVLHDIEDRHYMGYKGPDVGRFANIRAEWGEEITHGIEESEILKELGLDGTIESPEVVKNMLADAGHHPFMGFSGVDQLGFYAPLGVHTKLCRCADIVDDRVLVELELEANTLDEARQAESKLEEIAKLYNIVELLNPDEPPTMLYKRLN